MKAGAKKREGEQGFALLVVLAFLLIFASFLTPFVVASHYQVLTTNHSLRKTQLEFAAEAAAFVASKTYSNWPAEQRANMANKTVVCGSKNTPTIQMEFQDHLGLIDLNLSDAASIATGLESLGLETSEAKKLAGSIIEFRTPRRRPKEVGGPTPTAGYKFGYFETIVELHDFQELRGIEVSALEEVFSVYKKANSISLAYAPARLRDAFANSSAASDRLAQAESGASHVSIDIYMSNGERNWVSNRYFISYSDTPRTFVKMLSNSASPHSKKQWESKPGEADAETCDDLFGEALPVFLELH